MTYPFGSAMTLVKRVASGVNAYGDTAYTVTRTPVRGVFNNGVSIEADNQTVAQPAVYLPADTDVSWLDAIEIDGTSYEVDGAPSHWQSPFTGWRAGVEVRLKTALRPS